MISKYGPLGIRVDDRYRNIPEARIVEMLMLAGWAYELESPVAEETSKEALQYWTQIGLGFRRAKNGERLFDPVEVNNFLKRAGLDGRDGFWAERYVRTGRRLVSDLAAAGPSGVSNSGERQFVVYFRRLFNLRSVVPGSRLRLRAPLPLEGNFLRNLDVTPFAETVRDAQLDVHPGRLEVRIVACGEAEIAIGARLNFGARPAQPYPGEDAIEPDKALYLRPREGLIVVSERILAQSRSLAGASASSLEAVRAFWDYIHSELICGALHYDQIDAVSPCDWVLDSGWFDCQLSSALFVALCRARGVPARVLGGYLL
jgi:Transglutaminase-like superfamily